MAESTPAARFRLATARAPGAVAIVQLRGDIDAALDAMGVRTVPIGRAALRDLCAVDEGLVARWTETAADLTPHGGPAVVDALLRALAERGIEPADELAPLERWPEASDELEARALGAVARAASARAVGLLADQPRRWRAWDRRTPPRDEIVRRSLALNRLIDAPTVAALGGANIGKSTLLNALARRTVAVVASDPGVTRDHVGATLDLDGLTVRWLDTPGLRDAGASDPVEREARDLALRVARSADLVVLCADATRSPPDPADLGLDPDCPTLAVGLRDDLGSAKGVDVRTAAERGEGLIELARAVRTALVPDEDLAWEGPWAFDPALLGAAPGAESCDR